MRLASLAATAALAAVAATAFTAPAEAGSNVAYFGLRGSIIDTSSDNTTSGPIDYTVDYQDGFGVAGFLGWVLNDDFRLEVEAGFRDANLNSVLITRNDFDSLSDGHSYSVNGRAEGGAFMSNLYYDIHFLGDIGVLPWVGAGIGASYVDYAISSDINTLNGTTVLSAKNGAWAFAYQLMAGITVPLADGISGSVGYRFFETADFDYVDNFGVSFQTKLRQQSIDVGLQFHI